MTKWQFAFISSALSAGDLRGEHRAVGSEDVDRRRVVVAEVTERRRTHRQRRVLGGATTYGSAESGNHSPGVVIVAIAVWAVVIIGSAIGDGSKHHAAVAPAAAVPAAQPTAAPAAPLTPMSADALPDVLCPEIWPAARPRPFKDAAGTIQIKTDLPLGLRWSDVDFRAAS